MAADGAQVRRAIVVDDSEALRESHVRTLEGAGWSARGLAFEAAMTLDDAEILGLDLVVVDLHDSRSTEERAQAVAAARLSSELPWYDRLAGIRLLCRLDDLRVVSSRMPWVVVASAVMQIEPDLTARMYEFEVVTGGFSTLGVGRESVWLEKVVGAMSSEPMRAAVRAGYRKAAQDRWWSTVPRWRSYRALVRTIDRYPAAARFVLHEGGRPNRSEQRTLDSLNSAAGAPDHEGCRPRRDALRSLYRKILGWDLPHA